MVTPKKIAGISSAWVICTRLFNSIILVFLAIGCNTVSISNTPSLENGSGTAPRVSPTMIPVMPTFRDDFNGHLNPEWEWENEDASSYKVNEDGWLEITGGDESILSGGRQTNLLWITLPDGNFEVLIHLKSQPLFDYQRAGILLYQDLGHYVALSQGYCLQCLLDGHGIFLEYSLNGHHGKYTTASNASDLYLLLIVEQGAISAFYAIEAGQWRYIASLVNDIRFERAALSVTNDNTWDTGYDLISMFDYFEIRLPTQIVPTPTPGSFQQA